MTTLKYFFFWSKNGYDKNLPGISHSMKVVHTQYHSFPACRKDKWLAPWVFPQVGGFAQNTQCKWVDHSSESNWYWRGNTIVIIISNITSQFHFSTYQETDRAFNSIVVQHLFPLLHLYKIGLLSFKIRVIILCSTWRGSAARPSHWWRLFIHVVCGCNSGKWTRRMQWRRTF